MYFSPFNVLLQLLEPQSRMATYFPQTLKDNFQRYFHGKKCVYYFFFQRSISENSLVAMDFSGQKSRVIENPTEALSVAVEEGLAWRVHIASRSSKCFWFEFVLPQKLNFLPLFLVQKKGCLRLATHGSPTASLQSSATNMGTSARGPLGLKL